VDRPGDPRSRPMASAKTRSVTCTDKVAFCLYPIYHPPCANASDLRYAIVVVATRRIDSCTFSTSSSWWVNCCKTLAAPFAHIGTLHQAAPSTSLFCLRISVVPDHHMVCSCHFPSLYLKHPDAHMIFQLWALSRRQFGSRFAGTIPSPWSHRNTCTSMALPKLSHTPYLH
jgi:hypothetical protein